MRPEKGTFRILTRNCAVVVLVWLLLVASTIIIPQGNLYNGLLPSASAQQEEEEENGEPEQGQSEALATLQALSEVAPATDLEGFLVDLVEATDVDGLADLVGVSDSSELTQMPRVTNSGLLDLVDVTDLEGLLELVGLSDLEELLDLLDPQPSTTDPSTPGQEQDQEEDTNIEQTAEAEAENEANVDIDQDNEQTNVNTQSQTGVVDAETNNEQDAEGGGEEINQDQSQTVTQTNRNEPTADVNVDQDADAVAAPIAGQIDVEEEEENGEPEQGQSEALATLQALSEVAPATDLEGFLVDLVEATDVDGLADLVGVSDSSELTQMPRVTEQGLADLVNLIDMDGLLELVGLSDLEELLDLLIPPPTEEPPTEEPPTEEPPTEDPFTVEIISSGTEGAAPATIDFEANVIEGTEPYTISWDFGDGQQSNEPTVSHTFEQAGTYDVVLTVIDSDGRTAFDNIAITVTEGEEPPTEEPPTEEPPTEEPPTEEPPTEEPNPPSQGGGEDRFGIEQIYSTAGGGPTWYIEEQEDPTSDGYFYYGMYRTTTVDYRGNGVWRVDARSGTQEHGIRMHVDSPSGEWKNTEMTAYFRVIDGNDQFTMIARHGPSYHGDGGCLAYGYYGMTAVDGNVFFKKKLWHYDDGYTRRLAQIDALDNLLNDWIGMKFVVYDLGNGDVKLELWIDEGDMTNNWRKVTELVDDGDLRVEGEDCGRDPTHIVREGTRASFRVDDSLFDFKKLSVREIG